MAHNQRGMTLGDLVLGLIAVLFLAGWGLYELCYALAEAFE